MALSRFRLVSALVFALVFALYGTVACTDSPAAPGPADAVIRNEAVTSEDTPELRDGRLVFRDVDRFKAYLAPLVDVAPDKLARVEASFPGFTSLRGYLDDDAWWLDPTTIDWESDDLTGSAAKAFEADGVVREDFIFGDATLSVLNQRGELQIGKTVFKLTRDNSYEVRAEDAGILAERVPRLDSPAPLESDDRIVVRPVVSRVSAEEPDEASAGATFGKTFVEPAPRVAAFGIAANSCIRHLDAGLRMVGASYISWGYPFTEAGVLTEWERRKGSGRKAHWVVAGQAGTFSHSWSARLWTTTANGPLLVYDQQGQRTSPFGAAQLFSTLYVELNLGYFGVFGDIRATHRMTNPEFNPTCNTHLVFW